MDISIIMEGIAFIAFIYASMLAFLRYKQTKRVTNLWLLITMSLSLFSLVSLANVFERLPLQQMDIAAIEQIEVTIALTGIALFFSAVLLYNKERKLVRDGLDGKVKKYDKKKFADMKKWLDDL